MSRACQIVRVLLEAEEIDSAFDARAYFLGLANKFILVFYTPDGRKAYFNASGHWSTRMEDAHAMPIKDAEQAMNEFEARYGEAAARNPDKIAAMYRSFMLEPVDE